MGYNPNIFQLEVGYKRFTNHLLTSWDILVGNLNMDPQNEQISGLDHFGDFYGLKIRQGFGCVSIW